MENINVSMETPDHKYFCMIPNIVVDMGLSSQAISLYLHLKRVAGENGECWQSIETLAEYCRMSKSTVISVKKELEELGLITIRVEGEPGNLRHYISITDVWYENTIKYSSKAKDNQVPPSTGIRYPLVPEPVLDSTGSGTRRYLKKNPLRRIKKICDANASRPGANAPRHSVPQRKDNQENCIETSIEDYESDLNTRAADAKKNEKSPHNAMIDAVSKVTGIDRKIPANIKRLSRVAKQLRDAEYKVEAVDILYRPGGWWYKEDWRGKKGDKPKPEAILETIQNALEWYRKEREMTVDELMEDRRKPLVMEEIHIVDGCEVVYV